MTKQEKMFSELDAAVKRVDNAFARWELQQKWSAWIAAVNEAKANPGSDTEAAQSYRKWAAWIEQRRAAK
jgi:hypothetical protein